MNSDLIACQKAMLRFVIMKPMASWESISAFLEILVQDFCVLEAVFAQSVTTRVKIIKWLSEVSYDALAREAAPEAENFNLNIKMHRSGAQYMRSIIAIHSYDLCRSMSLIFSLLHNKQQIICSSAIISRAPHMTSESTCAVIAFCIPNDASPKRADKSCAHLKNDLGFLRNSLLLTIILRSIILRELVINEGGRARPP